MLLISFIQLYYPCDGLKKIDQFLVPFCNWLNLILVDLELTEFYHCKDSVIWDVIVLDSAYNKLAELRNRFLCIPASEKTSERSLLLLKKIVNTLTTRTLEELEMAKVYMNLLISYFKTVIKKINNERNESSRLLIVNNSIGLLLLVNKLQSCGKNTFVVKIMMNNTRFSQALAHFEPQKYSVNMITKLKMNKRIGTDSLQRWLYMLTPRDLITLAFIKHQLLFVILAIGPEKMLQLNLPL